MFTVRASQGKVAYSLYETCERENDARQDIKLEPIIECLLNTLNCMSTNIHFVVVSFNSIIRVCYEQKQSIKMYNNWKI